MMQRMVNYWMTLKALLLVDFVIFKKDYVNRVINVIIVVGVQVFVTVYLLPYFGLQADYGAFMIGAWLSGYPLWECYTVVANLTSDLSGEKKITYELLLPMPSSMVFLRIILSFALQSMIISFLIIPLSKLFLPTQFDLSKVSWTLCILIFIANNVFMGAFSILLVSMLKNMSQLRSAWQRFIFPLWILGGFQFSWVALYTIFPRVSYLELLNPMIYANEGFRSALLQDPTFISAKICIPLLSLFSLVFAYVGFKRIQKRLDFI